MHDSFIQDDPKFKRLTKECLKIEEKIEKMKQDKHDLICKYAEIYDKMKSDQEFQKKEKLRKQVELCESIEQWLIQYGFRYSRGITHRIDDVKSDWIITLVILTKDHVMFGDIRFPYIGSKQYIFCLPRLHGDGVDKDPKILDYFERTKIKLAELDLCYETYS